MHMPGAGRRRTRLDLPCLKEPVGHVSVSAEGSVCACDEQNEEGRGRRNVTCPDCVSPTQRDRAPPSAPTHPCTLRRHHRGTQLRTSGSAQLHCKRRSWAQCRRCSARWRDLRRSLGCRWRSGRCRRIRGTRDLQTTPGVKQMLQACMVGACVRWGAELPNPNRALHAAGHARI